MFTRRTTLLTLLLAVFMISAGSAQIRDHSSAGHKPSSSAKPKPASSNGFKPFKELIKDKIVTEGLFTFYRDTTDNSVLMAIKPDQLGPYFLCDMAKSTADGSLFDTGPLGRSFPFFFRRIGKNIQMVEKNLLFRADSTSTMKGAVEKGISDHLFAALPIKSEPQDST
ncbi:MAG: hypothetical protein NTW07_12195, partial [candidate division Zixibacteria bacterium]|nr:hypothetical protein [candidate division Zixibacteria bacterium]